MSQASDATNDANGATAAAGREVVLSVRDVTVAFGGQDGARRSLSLDVYRGEILGFVGASGTGKSVLLRTVLGLNRKQSGTIKLFDQDLDKVSDEERLRLDTRSACCSSTARCSRR